MPTLTREFIDDVRRIPYTELQQFVLQLAKRNKDIFDILNIEYLRKNEAREVLFEETKGKVLNHLNNFSFKGPIQKSLSAAIAKAVKEINYFVKITDDHNKEAELLDILLNEVFSENSNQLGTCWTVFDSKLGVTTRRLVNTVTKKLHEDRLLDFKENINRYLNILHDRSNHIDLIYGLPDKISD